MNTLALAPKVEPEQVERDFNNHIQDVLLVSYLSNTIRTQIDLSNRLATAALTMGPEHKKSGGEGKEGEQKQGGDRKGGNQREQRSGAGPRGQREQQ
jgi:translation initiation factor 3 subunit F